MFGATEKRGGYKPLDGNLEEQTPLNDEHNEPVLILRRRYNSAGLILSCLSTATIMIVIVVVLRTLSHPEPPKPSTCRGASLRREWRSLSMSEKHQYIDAVNCLRDQPSAIGLNQSLYDDFPYIHSRVGQYSHDSAAFIAWHRYFIHIYERQLREKCSYRGSLTYWDWSLDWEDFSKSPVWSNEHGFGGSGDPDVGETLLDGYCVTTGPFAHLSVIFIKHDYHPHCLSRGFVRDKDELAVHRAMYHPLTIDEIVSSDNYSHFNLNLEHGPHDGIPRSVRGDFSMLTAPADPVFFLHHTALDRLWWTWQQKHPHKWQEYIGRASNYTEESASLQDVIPMGDLAPKITVDEIMDTQGDLLCYRY